MAGDDNEQKPWERNYGTATATEDEDAPWKKNYGGGAAAPTDDLEEYLKTSHAGGKATASVTPQHEVEALPGGTARLKAAAKTFQAPTRFEKETPEIPENYGFTVGNIPNIVGRGITGLGNVAKFAGGALKDVYGAATSDDKIAAAKDLANKYIVEPQMAEAEAAKPYEEAARNEPFLSKQGLLDAVSGTGHRIASLTPLVGPWVAQHAEAGSRSGDIAGEAAETGGEMAGGELLHRAAVSPLKTGKALGRVGDYVARGTPLTEEGRLAAAKEQALTVKKPTMTETEYEGKVDAALPELQRIAQDNKGQIKNPRQAAAAIDNRVDQIEAPIRQHLATVPDAQQMVQATNFVPRVDQAMDQALARNAGHYTPEEIQKAKQAVHGFIGDQDKPLRELEGNRRRLNADSNAYFSSSPANKRLINASDAEAVAQRAAADEIRRMEYGDAQNPGELERVGLQATDTQGRPLNFREVRKTVGNLIDVRDHFEDAITRAENTGDWSAFQVMRKGPSLAAGGVGAIFGGAAGGPWGALLGTLMGEGAKAWADYRTSKNPNLNVTKMFRNLEQTTPRPTVDVTANMPAPVPTPAVAGALPAPATPMPGPVPVAGTPGFQNNRWVTPAAALPPVQPTPATFLREIPAARPNVAPAAPAGLLPERLGGVQAPETNIPPVVEPAFAREEVRPLGGVGWGPERQLGMVGRGGIRTTPLAGLPERVEPTAGGPGRVGELGKIGEKEARGATQRGLSSQERITALDREIANDRELLRNNPKAPEAPALQQRIRENQEELRQLRSGRSKLRKPEKI